MISRYTLDIDEVSRYHPFITETNTNDGEWVKYEDIKDLVDESFEAIVDKYEEISDKIENRWKALIGFGCGYFSSWKISGDNIHVMYERPCRQGGGITGPDIIPRKCFEVSLEEAKVIFLKDKTE